jgi:Nucleotidyltransferase/DNA polymerase involved in DNA repair
MTLADARARCPSLVSLPHDPQADLRELDRLAAAMLRFTPIAAADPPDGVMLDITGCAHLHGGETALARKVVSEAGYTSRHALADHAAAARALARHGAMGESKDVRALPIAALELPADAHDGLHRAGLATLGDLAAQPMASLAARFGQETVDRLRAVLGERDSPLVPLRSSTPLRAKARFAEPIARTEHVLDVIETLLADISRQMEVRQLGGRRFVVRLERTDGARRELAVETSLPSRDPARIIRLFQERIDHLADPLDPGFGFDAVALAVTRSDHLPPAQTAIAGEETAESDGVAALIDRLATRIGPGAIRRLHPRDTHIPEAAQLFLPALRSAPARWPDFDGQQPRPLLLFDPPQPVTALASVPDGPPQRLRWRGHLHKVVRAEGPERIAAEWWHCADGHKPGSGCLTRDYYRIEDETGCRYWVFRHGLFDETGEPCWYVHGQFP